MERVISPGLKEALQRNRSMLNSIYESVSPHGSASSSESFLRLFVNIVEPVYEKGLLLPDDLLEGIFRESLKLSSRGYTGASGRFQDIEKLLLEVLFTYTEILASEKGFITFILNALLNLRAVGTDAMHLWAEKIKGIKLSGLDDLKTAGVLLAWRCGAARFREAALSSAEKVTKNNLRYIFDLDHETDPALFIACSENDPWYRRIADSGPMFLSTGGFTGYGGPFRSIPDVYCHEGVLYASDAEREFHIYADSYGAELVPHRGHPPAKNRTQSIGTVYTQSREVVINGKSYPLPGNISGNVKSASVTGNTVAWSEHDSYMIFIAGRCTGNV